TQPNTHTNYSLSLHDALPISKITERGLVENSPAETKWFEEMAINCHGRRVTSPPLDSSAWVYSCGGTRAPASPCANEYTQALERSEEHTSELQSPDHLVCRPL